MVNDIYSKIDSDRFGINIGKVEESFFNDMTINESIDYFNQNEFDLITTRIDFSNLELINKLEARGFKICDIQTIMSYPLKNFNSSTLSNKNESYNIREFKKSDIDSIMDITTASFNEDYGGHYFNDTRLDSKDCADAYSDWVYNSCFNKNIADKIFISKSPQGELAGYISVKTFHRDGKKYADGVLGAVSPNHRGKGVFQDLAIRLIEWSKINKCDGVENNVLVDNYSVNRAYINLGYRPTKVTVTLHGWLNEVNI